MDGALCDCGASGHNPLSKANVGAPIFCRQGTLNSWADLEPPWLSCGTLGTEGQVGESPDADIPECWGWTLSDIILTTAAVQAHLTEWL